MIKQQQLMFNMVETARNMGASPDLIAELQAQSSPDFGAALDEMDDQVNTTHHPTPTTQHTTHNAQRTTHITPTPNTPNAQY